MFVNENLIPEIVINLVAKYSKTKDVNEKYQLEMRLTDIRNFIDSFLKEKKKF